MSNDAKFHKFLPATFSHFPCRVHYYIYTVIDVIRFAAILTVNNEHGRKLPKYLSASEITLLGLRQPHYAALYTPNTSTEFVIGCYVY